MAPTPTLPAAHARTASRAVPGRAPHRREPRHPLLTFVLAGLTTGLLLVVGGALVGRAAARAEAVRDARAVATAVARTTVEPQLRDELLTGDPAAREVLRSLSQHLTTDLFTRVKLWTPQGRIVFSDDPRLTGRAFALGEDAREALASGEAVAEISDLSKEENGLERELGVLLEAYVPVRTPGGQVLLFEAYTPLSSVSERAAEVWATFLPITVGGLVLLQLVQLPLAARLSRQARWAREERERMFDHALAASDTERRRIAADLHDGVVQDLAATAVSLSGTAVLAGRKGCADEARNLAGAADAVRAAIRALRSLVVDIYPPNLRRAGLAAALPDLAAGLGGRRVAATVDVATGATAGAAAERFLYRVAQEALRNVVTHAGAAAVDVRLERSGNRLVLTVTDDGAGFDPAGLDAPGDGRPRLGLRLLGDLALEVDGDVEVESGPGAGTRVRATVPAS
ncbi:sensor histidine kinase [Pseudonocardia hydrocarbonoxydans]|uniref:Histidine kinase domain-containing protein n=1 Tax=Pseudonocardia hydrocarbonoxydans TaxID=76726 RepID=A0A4Y3WLM6_9PSEU|nr:ATP-binding protein [Pseudonocardia hydrocarbonoxydans]GEC18276.1 hypothetical protein PHY01_05590 [Pseudonocardia hydrocarbonoxydans]